MLSMKTKGRLKQYRQSLLKHAFEGKLTEKWREVHFEEIKSASIILEKIVNRSKKNSKNERIDLPSLETRQELPNLRENWIWTKIGNVLK